MDNDRYLTPEEILEADDIKDVDVEVPEWPKKDGAPGVVKLRMFDSDVMRDYLSSVDSTSKHDAMLLVIVKSAIKPDGSPLFTVKQLTQLRKKSVKALSRLQNEIMRINGLGREGEKARENAKND